jgi:transcriptional regulator with XRE-family HTH domain
MSGMSYLGQMTTNRDGSVDLNRAIGGRVAWYMKYAGETRRTQTELAQLLGIEQSAVSKKLTGRRPFFPHELYAVAEWLDRPLGDFLPLSERLSSPPSIETATGTGEDTHRSHSMSAELAVA